MSVHPGAQQPSLRPGVHRRGRCAAAGRVAPAPGDRFAERRARKDRSYPGKRVISMGRKLDGAVVMVTGASSGIGRATGLAFADRGARAVLAARRVDALDEPARECRAVGGQALAVPTDTTDEAAVTELARRAVEWFGRIDVWVNNASVYSHVGAPWLTAYVSSKFAVRGSAAV